MDIKMVVMDWAGTTVDYGCFAPVHAFAKAFEEVGITPTMQEIREPMGLLKMDHIRAMLSMKRIQRAWIAKYQQAPTVDDVERIYDIFEKQNIQIRNMAVWSVFNGFASKVYVSDLRRAIRMP